MLTRVKLPLFGYLRLRITAGVSAAVAGRRLLADFAHEEGFALADVFIDADENNPQSALAALIGLVRGAPDPLRGSAIAVPHLGHLGTNPGAQLLMRRRIEREAQTRLIIVQAS